MTCSGCEVQLVAAFRNIQFVTGLRTSLLLARADFDLDVSSTTVEDVIAKLKQATTYAYGVIPNGKGQILDVLTADADAFCARELPEGVLCVRKADSSNKRVYIHYDATKGTRNILAAYLPEEVMLADPKPPLSTLVSKRQLRKEFLLFAFSAIATVPVLVLGWTPSIPISERARDIPSLVLATLVQLIVVLQFYPNAFKSLFRSRLIEVDLLIVLSTTAAYAFSVIAFSFNINGNPLQGADSYFETSTILVTFILLGRYLSELARHKATESVSVRALQADTTLLLDSTRTRPQEIDSRLLQYGDVFRVPPYTRIVTDGTVVFGGSEVDESMLTGETNLVAKGIGSEVIAGSMNGSGQLDVSLTKLPFENTVNTIATLVDEAELCKPRTQAIADRVAGYFVPVIVAISLVAFVVQLLVRSYGIRQPLGQSAVEALTYAIATLIISCPCAIGLAVPMVVVIAGSVASKHGLIFKSPQMIEVVHKTTHIIFDKTGTLTEGILSVVSEEYLGARPPHEIKSLLLGLVDQINHPVAAALSRHLASGLIQAALCDDVTAIPGMGVEGQFQGSCLRAGSSRWLGVNEHPVVQKLLQQNLTVLCLKVDGHLAAAFGLQDSIREEADKVITSLYRRGIRVSIVSGDEAGAVQAVASKLGIPSSNVRSRCSPDDKRKYVEGLLRAPQRKKRSCPPTIIFVGDGTNDAPALTMANVGIHMPSLGSGPSDIAKSAADVILIRPNLGNILIALDLARAAYKRILFNFAWSGMYNVLAVAGAAGAFVHGRIPPQYAGLGEIVSVLPVVAVAFGLRWVKFKKRMW